MNDTENIEQCPKCKSISLNVDVCSGLYTCSRCGFEDKKDQFNEVNVEDLYSRVKGEQTQNDFKTNFK